MKKNYELIASESSDNAVPIKNRFHTFAYGTQHGISDFVPEPVIHPV